MKVTAIILTVNQRDWTLQCLSSLMRQKEPSFSVLVWDNGSQDGTTRAIQETFPGVLVHQNSVNLGVASGRNAAAGLAIQSFGPTHLLFLDNDMIFEENFVSALSKPFLEDARVGQTQAKLRFYNDRSRLNDGGGAKINFILGKVLPVGYEEIDLGQYDFRKKCIACGGAMMVRSDVFRQLNGFDTIFDPFGPEDLDFSLRLQKAGYDALFIPEAVAYHAVSHTFGLGYTGDYARRKSKHWIKFLRRHSSPAQQLGFFLIGAPYLGARVIIREGRKKNLGAILGLVRGMLDVMKHTLLRGE